MAISERAVAALRQHAAQRSEQKRRAVLEAIHRLTQDSSEITISSVARRAEVSREFIHSHPQLRHAVHTAAKTARQTVRTASRPDAGAGLRAERSTLLAQVERQRSVIAQQRKRIDELERQRQRWLGDQLAELVVIDPDTHAAVRIENDRLATENAEVKQQLSAARRNVQQLEAELAASRRAHAEDVAALNGSAPVTPLVAPRR
jgi:hypothetical protein